MPLLRLVVRRIVFLVFVLLGVTFVTFTVSHLIPGDPARMMVGQRASEETLQRVREQLGLNEPVPVQYARYLAGLLRGDLGTSIRTQRPVAEDLATYFPATLELALAAMFLAVLVGVPLGVISATRQNTWVDHLGRVVAIGGVSMPIFWFGLMALLVFYRWLGWFPGSERLDAFLSPPPRITGLYLVDSLLTGNLPVFWNSLWHLVLPASCLAYVQVAAISRLVRASMLEVLSQDYIRTVRAAGLPGWVVVYGHALRNALIPVVTGVGLSLGELLGGAVLTETIFSWPGMGKYVVDSVTFLDFPAIMGFTIVVAVGYVVINLVVDLSYYILDPRVREVG